MAVLNIENDYNHEYKRIMFETISLKMENQFYNFQFDRSATCI